MADVQAEGILTVRDEAQPPKGPYDKPKTAKSPKWAMFKRQFDLIRVSDEKPYLTRWWIIKTPWWGIAVHRMTAPDARETLHDHPFSFFSVVLRGGYSERRLNTKTYEINETHEIKRFNRMRKYDFHSIRYVKAPTWTLLFCGKYRRTWGFFQPNEDGTWTWVKHDYFDSGHYLPEEKGRSV